MQYLCFRVENATLTNNYSRWCHAPVNGKSQTGLGYLNFHWKQSHKFDIALMAMYFPVLWWHAPVCIQVQVLLMDFNANVLCIKLLIWQCTFWYHIALVPKLPDTDPGHHRPSSSRYLPNIFTLPVIRLVRSGLARCSC